MQKKKNNNKWRMYRCKLCNKIVSYNTKIQHLIAYHVDEWRKSHFPNEFFEEIKEDDEKEK